MGPEGCHAKLLAGSLHDDRLLVYENMSIDSFSSPYTVQFATHSSAEGKFNPDKRLARLMCFRSKARLHSLLWQ